MYNRGKKYDARVLCGKRVGTRPLYVSESLTMTRDE